MSVLALPLQGAIDTSAVVIYPTGVRPPEPVLAVYDRISKDAAGTGYGVHHQGLSGLEYAAVHLPGVPVKLYEDNDVSAYDPSAIREDWLEVLADAEDGLVVGIVVQSSSRLSRQPGLNYKLRLALNYGRRGQPWAIHYYGSGEAPQVHDGDHLSADMAEVVNYNQSAKSAKNISQRLREYAVREGRPGGGSIYGYDRPPRRPGEPASLVVNEHEASVIRRVYGEIIEGRSLRSIVLALNADGLVTKYGKPWRRETLKDIMVGYPIAGKRKVGTKRIPAPAGSRMKYATVWSGETTDGAWTPILNEQEWNRVRDILNAPVVWTDKKGVTRQATRRRGVHRARKYILTGGLARCGLCGEPLTAQAERRNNREPVEAYSCCRGGGHAVRMVASDLESVVLGALAHHLRNRDLDAGDDIEADQAAADAKVEALRARGEDLGGRLHALDGFALEQTLNALARISAELKDAERERAAILPTGSAAFSTDEDLPALLAELRASEDEADRERLWSFIRMFIAEITLNRASAGRGARSKGPDYERVKVRFIKD